jgi:hypothetical protein
VIGVLLGLLAVLLFLLFAWLFGAFDNQDDPTTDSSTPASGPSDSSQPEDTPSSPSEDPEVRVEQMQAFITDYAALAVDDPRTSWQMLTPDFQKASGGFGNYKKFWDQWSSAIPANIEADPDALTATYDITYTRADGGPDESDTVTLQLVEDGDGFLIDGES